MHHVCSINTPVLRQECLHGRLRRREKVSGGARSCLSCFAKSETREASATVNVCLRDGPGVSPDPGTPCCHEEATKSEQAEEAELEALEAELSVNDILLFRTMAERQAQSGNAAPRDEQQLEEEEVFQDATEVM